MATWDRLMAAAVVATILIGVCGAMYGGMHTVIDGMFAAAPAGD